MSDIKRAYRLLMATIRRFLEHDGWALASHIAMTILMSLFPFFILVTAIASLFGSAELADQAAGFLFETWPAQVAQPIAEEIRQVLTVTRNDVLTIGALFAVYFSSSGVEAMRIGLNRAYGCYEWRPWYLTRLESIFFVLLGATSLIVFTLLVVLGPVLWQALTHHIPGLRPIGALVVVARFTIAGLVMFAVLTFLHMLLPAGRRRLRQVLPGVIVTIVLWFAGGTGFGIYLKDFGSQGYVTTYAGLASGAIALVFLYLLAAIFLFGGELNAAIADEKNAGDGIGG